MAGRPHVLSVGKDAILMSSRTLLLSNAGYAVEEAYSLDKAATLVELDSIVLTLLCHTVPPDERQVLISLVQKKKPLIPIICIRSYAYESFSRNCTAVDNDPEALLQCLKSLIRLN
jgi:DNA-binding NtrC family response regulator